MNDYVQYLSELIPDKDSLKIVKTEAKKYYKEHTSEECYAIYPVLYQSDNFQIQEVGVFLAGYIADEYPDALAFLHDTVSHHESWKVQEILAMAFDNHCARIGYENALPLIKEWFADENANIRRAASEGLRVWTSRPFFKEHPQIAIALLASHKDDESEYVRKSAGNSLRDISKKFPDLIAAELRTWDLSAKQTMQVYKLAGKFLDLKSSLTADEWDIRCLKREEYSLLESFLYDAIYVPKGVAAPPKEIIHQPELAVYIEDFGQPDDVCLVAESQGHILGAVWTRILAGKVKGYGNIDDGTPEFAISVKKEFRHQGIGSRLMQEMIALLKDKGYEKTSLSVNKDNYAYQMYRNLGFRVVKEQDEDYLMVLELQNYN